MCGRVCPRRSRVWLSPYRSRLQLLSHVDATVLPLADADQFLAAGEDKTYRGAYVASPSSPWAFGRDDPSAPYHLVWSRDLYQIASALALGAIGAGFVFEPYFAGHAYDEFWKGALFTGEHNHILHARHDIPTWVGSSGGCDAAQRSERRLLMRVICDCTLA